ncbi:Allergen Asp f 4 [Phlyctema vagabunda]|uniref:Allergen Asp f 4 n=1 Tax=Phlyctema vagabunda TaxID=108571 RepID=A0ABR4PFS6_9HELO
MRYSFATAALLSAMAVTEVVAGPAHHVHRHLHEKKEIVNVEKRDNMVYATIDGKLASWVNNFFGETATTASAASAATAPAVNAAKVSATATKSSTTAKATSASDLIDTITDGIDDAVSDLWNDLKGFSNDLTEFGASTVASGALGDFYSGNCGSPYGSNMIKVSSRSGYDFTNEFINTSGETITVVVWNKIGSDGQILSGSALAPKSPALTFALKPGKSQIVAFDDNSQVGWAQATSDLAFSGAFATTWGEGQFRKEGSGVDVSAIMNAKGNNYNMSITTSEISCISDMTQNMWLTDTTPVGDSNGSCYIPGSTATVTTTMGGTV